MRGFVHTGWGPIVVGAAAAAGSAVGVGAAALALVRSSTGDEGPTAATIDETFSALFGYELGLAVALAVVGALVRPPRGRCAIAAALAFLLTIPAIVFTSSSDLELVEHVSGVGFVAALSIPIGFLACSAGARMRRMPRSH